MNRLIRAARKIGTLPEIFRRIEDAVNDPSVSLDGIARILTEDPVLTARLLRIANSSLFGFPMEIKTITRALTIIGTRQLRDLVMATSVIQHLPKVHNHYMQTHSFWCHSIACGLVARVLATYRRESNVEYYYLTGLMHDIGRLVMAIELPNEYDTVMQRCMEESRLLHEVEREVFEFDHAFLGGKVLETWKLPPHITQPIGFHHQPSLAEAYAEESAIIHVADIIAIGMRLEGGCDLLVPPLEPWAWDRIGLPASIMRSVLRLVENQYEEAVNVFLDGA